VKKKKLDEKEDKEGPVAEKSSHPRDFNIIGVRENQKLLYQLGRGADFNGKLETSWGRKTQEKGLSSRLMRIPKSFSYFSPYFDNDRQEGKGDAMGKLHKRKRTATKGVI